MFKNIQQDKHFNLFQQGEYHYAKNIVQNELVGSITNELGNKLIDAIPDSQYQPVIIGYIQDVNNFVLFVKRGDVSEIWVLYEDALKQIDLNGVDLTFNLGYPIQGTLIRNFKNEVIIAFTDNFNKPKVINIGQIENSSPQASIDDIKDTLMFPEANYGLIQTTINVGGSLRTGTHQIAVRYKNKDNSYSNFVNYSELQYIGSSSEFSPSDLNSGKRLSVTLTNIDTTYTYFEVAHIQYVNNVFEARLLSPIYITRNTMSFDVLGTETSVPISYEEVIVAKVNYTKGKTITQINNTLHLGNIREVEEFDYQPYANMITSVVQSTAVNLSTQHTNNAREVHQGFQHGEVYAFYIAFVKLDGTMTRAFHIPSRQVLPSEKALTNGTTFGNVIAKTFQVLDTATLGAFTPNVTALSSFNAWENENEVYPNESSYNSTALGGEDLRGQPVRHHHFPSQRWFNENVYTFHQYGRSVLDVLGVQFNNIVIPQEIADNCTGFKILYAQRTFANTTNYGNFLYHPSAYWYQQDTPADILHNWSTGGNWLTWHLFGGAGSNDDQLGIPQNGTLYGGRRLLRANNLDLYLNQPEIPNGYVSAEVMIETTGIYQKYQADLAGSCDSCNGGRFLDFVGTSSGVSYLLNKSDYLRSITSTKYIPYNTIENNNGSGTDGSYNKYTEAHLQIDLGFESYTSQFARYNNISTLPAVVNTYPSTYFTIDDGANAISCCGSNITCLMSLKSIKSDVYNSFLSQTLLDTDANYIISSAGIFGASATKGDIWVSQQTHNTYSTRARNDNNFQNYYTHHFRWLGETINNQAFKYETENKYSKFNPYSDPALVQWTPDFSLNGDPNAYAYDKSFSLLEPAYSVPYNPQVEFTGRFPQRIVRSLPNQEEQRELGWRTWLANELYEMPKDKGVIINLVPFGKQLLIHHENTLYRTIGDTRIQTEDTVATLGTGDIFSVPPEEVIPLPNGYGGTQHQFGTCVSKAGYSFVDAKQGKVFLYNGELQEISNKGMYKFFYDNLQLIETIPITHSIELKTTKQCLNNGNKRWVLPKRVKYRIENKEVWLDIIPTGEYFNDLESNFYYYLTEAGVVNCQGIERKQITIEQDNPYYGAGYSIAWDERLQRLIVSKIADNKVIEGTETRQAIWYLPDDYVIKGAFRQEDKNFIDCLCVGDIVIKDGEYKTITNFVI